MYRSSSIKTQDFCGLSHLDLVAFTALPVHRGQWLFQQNRKAGANSGQEPVGSSSAAHSIGCEISTEELNTLSPSEDVSILPGRVHKEKCGTLWIPGVWVSAPEQTG